MPPIVFADLRYLQDPDFRIRGIGGHVAALFRARKRSAASGWKTVGLVDQRMPRLPPEFSSLVDETSSSVNPCRSIAPAVFIDGSPMTHDTRFALRFENHPAFLRTAIVYDFIPLDWARHFYLPTVADRIDYLAKIARLRKFDLFLPISEYAARRLSEVIGISRDRIRVTGASVRRSLYELRDRVEIMSSPYDRKEPYFLIVIATDIRKNPEVAIKAIRHLNFLYGRCIPLKIVGHYNDARKRHLLELAGHGEGAGFLEFCPKVSDEELVRLYGGAIATIVSSHIEGFSLPIVEASVCGCPVIASTCAAHLELVEQTEALFPADDSAVLAEKLDALLQEPSRRASIAASQAHLGTKFHEHAVGQRFWNAVEDAIESRRNFGVTTRSGKPLLAFLSPYPPDRSHAASYTAMTMHANKTLFHSDLYTDADRPLTFEGSFGDAGTVSLAPLVAGRYDAVISVLGNSSCHTRIFDVFERYGGPCILHDVRLTQIYFHRLGQEEFLKFASKLLGRSVSMEEVNTWLEDRNPPSLFLEPIVEHASPLIVHTVTQQALLKKRYGIEAQVATCCPTAFFEEEELTTFARQAARERYRIPSPAFLLSSFGPVARTTGWNTCILAVELLLGWNIPAELYFIGDAGPAKREIDQISAAYGISEHVHSGPELATNKAYRDFLIASDAAIQLRSYEFGQVSTPLADCISAGLPGVATSDLVKSCGAPEYVLTVPDQFSPLQVAEQLALIWEAQTKRPSYADARMAYLEKHNFEYYGKRLIEILGIA